MKPRLLDLFCGAGGAAMGYHRAGFEVVGVDIAPQPHYPFEFHQAEALQALRCWMMTGEGPGGERLQWFDAIHVSPPCQSYSVTTNFRPENREKYPDLVGPTRELLESSAMPWVIENVPGAPLRNHVQLCGSGFGMLLRRHRWFEASFPLWGVPCAHGQQEWSADYKHSTGRKRRRVVVIGEYRVPFALQCEAMEVDWMNLAELSEAVPPRYTEHVGQALMTQLKEAV